MAKTLVGVFDDKNSAQTVVRELQAAGIPGNQIRSMDNTDASATSPMNSTETEAPWTERVGNWFNSLFEDDADRSLANNYTEAWRRGSYIVVADVEDTRVDEVVAVMNRYGTVDLTRRAQVWEKSGYKGTVDRSAPLYTAADHQRELESYGEQQREGQSIPVVQEELKVGKRVVQRGGVRIHSYVEERPVEQLVQLREEHVNVQRRPVNRAATGADLAFQEKTIDVSASVEEVVVEKQARVVEEVVVAKNTQEREETVRETVRRKDVKVEQMSPPDARRSPPQPARHR